MDLSGVLEEMTKPLRGSSLVQRFYKEACDLHAGMFPMLVRTDQDILNLIIPTFDVVEHHVLSDVFPVLQLVHLVVCVRV